MAAFAGGPVRLAGTTVAATAVVVRLGGRAAGARAAARAHPRRGRAPRAGGCARAGRAGCASSSRASRAAAPHVLDVPVPGERRTLPRSHQHLAGRLTLTVRRGGRLLYRGESALAGLEHGV